MEGMLPTTRHIRELITHAEEHMNCGKELDSKVSLTHADNAIEIMLKEYLRSQKERAWDEIEDLSFYKLLGKCDEINLVRDSKKFFLAYHDMRNAVYHTGTLVPQKEDLKAAVGFAKTLFNELHPDLRFDEASIELPSKKSIDKISTYPDFRPYLHEITLTERFGVFFIKNGYTVSFEQPMSDGRRADLVAEKGTK